MNEDQSLIDFMVYKLTGRKVRPSYPANDNAGQPCRSVIHIGFTLSGSILMLNEYGTLIESQFESRYFDNAGYRDIF